MRLPATNAGFMTRVGYGHYVFRRLTRAGFDDLATTVSTVNTAVRTQGRRVEDLELPTMEAVADRDADDDDLDDTAQHLRLQLSSRKVGAEKERPYTDVFPKGIEYYTAANLGEQQTRYKELIQRTAEHLPAGDPVRVEGTPKLQAHLTSWVKSAEELGASRNALAIARTARDAAVDDWISTIEKVYGALVSKVGRKKADRFFPKISRRKAEEQGGEGEETG